MARRVLAFVAAAVALVGVPAALVAWEALRPAQAARVRSRIQTVLSPAVRVAHRGASGLSAGLEFLVTSAPVRRENALLRRKIARLELENSFLRETLSKYRRLDKGAALAQIGEWRTEEADVIAYSGRRWARSLTINRGAHSGVGPGDPVLHTQGLAGVIAAAGPWTSTVQLLNDPESAVGVIVLPSRARGVVRGTGDLDRLEIVLEDPAATLRKGQPVITSGMEGSLYPRGIPVGVVGDLKTNRFGQVIAEVEPAVPLGRIEEVLVVKTRPEKEGRK
jgi:rod shape-determining protein MreC